MHRHVLLGPSSVVVVAFRLPMPAPREALLPFSQEDAADATFSAESFRFISEELMECTWSTMGNAGVHSAVRFADFRPSTFMAFRCRRRFSSDVF
jgi:hypothetical protein